MPDWLKDGLAPEGDLTAEAIAARLALACVFGCVAAGVHLATQARRREEVASFSTTLVLLTVLIAMVNLVIGNSVARAFSLVGALAIVRFRTVVEDTRDTAFVIFAVTMGMAAGAGYLLVAFVGAPIVTVAACAMHLWGRAAPALPQWEVKVRVGLGRDVEMLCGPVLDRHVAGRRLASMSTVKQGAAIEVAYRFQAADAAVFAVVGDLNRQEGVQQVETRLA